MLSSCLLGKTCAAPVFAAATAGVTAMCNAVSVSAATVATTLSPALV